MDMCVHRLIEGKGQINTPHLGAIDISGTRIITQIYGSKKKRYYVKQVLLECPECENARWVTLKYLTSGQQKSTKCHYCINKEKIQRWNSVRVVKTGKDSPTWKGGTINGQGYRMMQIRPDNPFFGTANKWGRIREHRLVMAEHLGRNLERWEIVHHKNGNRLDNKIENLQLLPQAHTHTMVDKMRRHIERLEKENKRLKEQLILKMRLRNAS